MDVLLPGRQPWGFVCHVFCSCWQSWQSAPPVSHAVCSGPVQHTQTSVYLHVEEGKVCEEESCRITQYCLCEHVGNILINILYPNYSSHFDPLPLSSHLLLLTYSPLSLPVPLPLSPLFFFLLLLPIFLLPFHSPSLPPSLLSSLLPSSYTLITSEVTALT